MKTPKLFVNLFAFYQFETFSGNFKPFIYDTCYLFNKLVCFGFWMRLILKNIKTFVRIENYLHAMCIYEHEIDLSDNELIL